MTFKSLTAILLLIASQWAVATPTPFRIDAEVAKSNPAEARAWRVQPNVQALDSEHDVLLLTLPGKAPIQVARTSIERRPSGLTWRGRIGTQPVLIQTVANNLHAEFHVGLEHYVISSQRGRSVLSLTSRSETRTDAVNRIDAPNAAKSNTTSPAMISATTVRVLVGYSDAARFSAGGDSEIQATADFLIAQLNAIVASSVSAELQFELAGTMLLPYADGLASNIALQTLTTDADVAALRDQLAADIVVGLLENSDFAGRAYLPTQISTANASLAFAVVSRPHALNYAVFAHEVGHLFGLDHGSGSPSGQTGNGTYPWAQGHVGEVNAAAGYPEGFVTVMAPIGLCGGSPPCYEVPYFSNPELTQPEAPVRGRALGIPQGADNAQAMRLAAATIASYREGEPDPDPDLLSADSFEYSEPP